MKQKFFKNLKKVLDKLMWILYNAKCSAENGVYLVN